MPQTLGTSSVTGGGTVSPLRSVGIVMPLRWWFQKQTQAQQLPGQVPVDLQPADEPPAPKPAAVPAPKLKTDNDGGGFNKTRESIQQDVKAGSVNSLGDFVSAAIQGPAGPIGAMTFLGRLMGGQLLGGVPGANIDNSNQDAATQAAAAAAAARAAASPKPFNRANAFKPGQALFDRKKKNGGAGASGSGSSNPKGAGSYGSGLRGSGSNSGY